MNLRFQLKKMIRSLQYRVAFLISSVCVCLALFLEVWKNRGVDRFAVVSASEAVCGYGLSYGWKIFSAIWPFLIVLACSTSYVSEKKNRCVSVILVRTNWKSYLRGKLAVSAIGSMSVVLIPLLLNMLLCYFIFPNNLNLSWGAYEDNMYEISLLGENLFYSSVNPQYLFLNIYLESPVLYQLLYFLILGVFSGICGAFVMAISFVFSGNIMILFLPIYLICVGTMQLNSLFFARILNIVNGNIESTENVSQSIANAERIQEQTARYLDLYLMDYLASMTSSSCSMLYLLIWALILSVIIVLLYFYASHRELNAQQG